MREWASDRARELPSETDRAAVPPCESDTVRGEADPTAESEYFDKLDMTDAGGESDDAREGGRGIACASWTTSCSVGLLSGSSSSFAALLLLLSVLRPLERRRFGTEGASTSGCARARVAVGESAGELESELDLRDRASADTRSADPPPVFRDGDGILAVKLMLRR